MKPGNRFPYNNTLDFGRGRGREGIKIV